MIRALLGAALAVAFLSSSAMAVDRAVDSASPSLTVPTQVPPMCQALPKSPELKCERGRSRVCAKYEPCNAGTAANPKITRKCVEFKCVGRRP